MLFKSGPAYPSRLCPCTCHRCSVRNWSLHNALVHGPITSVTSKTSPLSWKSSIVWCDKVLRRIGMAPPCGQCRSDDTARAWQLRWYNRGWKILVSVVRFRPGLPRTSFTQRPLIEVGVVVSGIRSPRVRSISGCLLFVASDLEFKRLCPPDSGGNKLLTTKLSMVRARNCTQGRLHVSESRLDSSTAMVLLDIKTSATYTGVGYFANRHQRRSETVKWKFKLRQLSTERKPLLVTE